MKKSEIEKLFYLEKNYSRIKELLKDSSESWSFNILGKIFLLEGDCINAYNYFMKSNFQYGCGYCKFLQGELEEAENIFQKTDNDSSASRWIMILIQIITDNITKSPTYFQIRNYFEQDMEMLFLYNCYDYIKKVVNKIQYLENYNREIYKYTARVLLNHNCIDIAEKLLKKSLDICYKDPETHYMLGDIYLRSNKILKAKLSYNTAIEVNGDYFPAKNKLNRITN